MRLLLCYLILTGFFLLSVNCGSPDKTISGPNAPMSGFYEVSQDGTISAATVNPVEKSAARRDELNQWFAQIL